MNYQSIYENLLDSWNKFYIKYLVVFEYIFKIIIFVIKVFIVNYRLVEIFVGQLIEEGICVIKQVYKYD